MRKLIWFMFGLLPLVAWSSSLIAIQASKEAEVYVADSLNIDHDAMDNFVNGYYEEKTDKYGEMIRNRREVWFPMLLMPLLCGGILLFAWGMYAFSSIVRNDDKYDLMVFSYLWRRASKKKKFDVLYKHIKELSRTVNFDFDNRISELKKELYKKVNKNYLNDKINDMQEKVDDVWNRQKNEILRPIEMPNFNDFVKGPVPESLYRAIETVKRAISEHNHYRSAYSDDCNDLDEKSDLGRKHPGA